jgi:hypothetical protein
MLRRFGGEHGFLRVGGQPAHAQDLLGICQRQQQLVGTDVDRHN